MYIFFLRDDKSAHDGSHIIHKLIPFLGGHGGDMFDRRSINFEGDFQRQFVLIDE